MPVISLRQTTGIACKPVTTAASDLQAIASAANSGYCFDNANDT